MKVIGIIALLSAAMTVSARACNQGGWYCGTSLLNKGNYYDHIVAVLTDLGRSTDDTSVHNTLFECMGGGEIEYIEDCIFGCGGTDSTEDDYCLQS